MSGILTPEEFVDPAFDASPIKREDYCALYALMIEILSHHPARLGDFGSSIDTRRDALNAAVQDAMKIMTVVKRRYEPHMDETDKEEMETLLCTAALIHVDKAGDAIERFASRLSKHNLSYQKARCIRDLVEECKREGIFPGPNSTWNNECRFLVAMSGVMAADKYIKLRKNPETPAQDLNDAHKDMRAYKKSLFGEAKTSMEAVLFEKLEEAQALFRQYNPGAEIVQFSKFRPFRPPVPQRG